MGKYAGIISMSVLFLALLSVSCVPQDLKQKVDINVIGGGDNLITTESGSEASLLIYLSTAPTSNVTFPFESSNPAEILLGNDQLPEGEKNKTTSLVFTPENWSDTQKLILYGQDDPNLDGNQDVTIIIHPALSDDNRYRGLDHRDYAAVNEDNDEAGIHFSGIILSDITLTDLTPADFELGELTLLDLTFADFILSDAILIDEEKADLVVSDLTLLDLTLADDSLGKRTLAHLALADITQANYALSDLTLTDTAVERFDLEVPKLKDHVLAEIVLKDRTLKDVAVNNIALNDVLLKNLALTKLNDLSTSESGKVTKFSASLNTKPKEDVVFDLTTLNKSEGLLSLNSSSSTVPSEVITVTFTEENWNTPQVISVYGQNDFVVDGDGRYDIFASLLQSGDADYNNVKPSDVSVNNIDDDIASYTICPSMPVTISEFEKVCDDRSSPLVISEEGENTFYLYFDSRPAQFLTVSMESNATQIGKLKLAGDDAEVKDTVSVGLPPSSWNIPQPVTIVRQSGAASESVSNFSITFLPVLTKDSKFQRLIQPDLEVINLGNAPGVFIHPAKDLVTSEDGQTAEFTVRLTSKPLSPVAFLLTSDAPEEGLLIGGNSPDIEVAEIVMEFTADNWSTNQRVTVKGQNDALADNNQTYEIISEAVISDDINFQGLKPKNIRVTNIDDDSPGFIFTPISRLETSDSGKMDQFSFALTTKPDADVVVDVSVTDSTEGRLSKDLGDKHVFKLTMVFTPLNWSIPQVVYVVGIGDDFADGFQTNNITLVVNNNLTIDTSGYIGVASTISVNNIDDDS